MHEAIAGAKTSRGGGLSGSGSAVDGDDDESGLGHGIMLRFFPTNHSNLRESNECVVICGSGLRYWWVELEIDRLCSLADSSTSK